ncbi:MAG: low molecular weight phosphatase family protein [Candidatus Acidiferrum sp.]
MEKSGRKRVLFVCLGNACRSPMAEAIASRNASDVIQASSAGLTPLGRLEPMTKQTLANNGYSSEGLESKPLLSAALQEADIVVNMSGRRGEMAFRDLFRVEDWDVEDPYGAGAELYQTIFEEIEQRVGDLAERLRDATRSGTTSRKFKRKGVGG